MRHGLFALLLLSLSSSSSAQEGSGPYGSKYTVNKLTENVCTLTWQIAAGSFAIGNSTFIIGDADVVVVDSGFSKASGEAIVAGLRRITTKPVSMVINTTHWHADHIFGNQVFRTAFPHVRFAAHPETRAGIMTGEIDYRTANRPKTEARIVELKAKATLTEGESRELRIAEMQVDSWQGDYVLPDLLVDQHLTVMQRNRTIELRHLGHANTKGDLVVHLPAERILISGDMAITPVPFAFLSSPRLWIQTLDRLSDIDVDTIVPGHGPAQNNTQFVRDLQAMLTSIVEQVEAGLKAGLDVEALKKSVTVTPPPRSVYATISAASLDRSFRVPAIESAVREAKERQELELPDRL